MSRADRFDRRRVVLAADVARGLESVIEAATGRRVIGFMSGNQQDPDIMCEVFILDPTDLLDDHEIADRRRTFDG